MRSVVAGLLSAGVLALAGCGQKGALYLPESGGEVITRPMQTPAEAAPADTPPADTPTADAPPADAPTRDADKAAAPAPPPAAASPTQAPR
jgi:predicted small lipoprotein YifL